MTDRPLRFCMITTFYPPCNFGGDGIFVHRLSNELARRGHSVDVIHCVDSYRALARRDPSAAAYNDHPNVRVHGLRSRLGYFSPLATQQTGRPVLKSSRIRRILQKGFDVIHYHNISLIGGPKILEYGSAVKLYTMHEYWLVCQTHVLFRFNSGVCIRPHCFTCSLKYGRPPQLWRHSGMMHSSLRHVDAFIAPSRFSKDIHERRGLGRPSVHLPHFIPLAVRDAPAPQPRAIAPRQKPYFLFVGRLEKIKGLQTLIPVFHRYEKAQLWIAGEGAQQAELRRLAAGSENIRFLGRKSESELETLYRNAVALVVPSLAYEVFPLVILESFSQRTPVVVRNIGGMPEIVRESGGGLIYDTDEELLACMERVSGDISYRNHLGASGRETLERKWTAEAHLESYFGLIRQIADRRRIASDP